MKGLMLHTGANTVEFPVVEQVPVPEATDTYQPIAHATLWELVRGSLVSAGFQIQSTVFALWQEGLRFFALAEILSHQQDYNLVVGVRNSHDKTFPAGLVLGNQVFVCDNLSFSGEVRLARKHTTFIMRDLPGLTARAVAKLTDVRQLQSKRIEVYKQHILTDPQVHDILIRALDARALTITKLPAVVDVWRQPLHAEFEPRTVWSLLNAFTEVAKGNLLQLPNRTQSLYGLMDGVVGLIAPKRENEVEADYTIEDHR